MNPSRALLLLLLAAGPAFSAPDDRFDSGASSPLPAPPAPPSAPAPKDGRFWITSRAATSAARSALADAGVSLEEITPGHVGGVASARAVARLKKAGIAFTAVPLGERFGPLDFPRKDAAFHNYSELAAALESLAAGSKGLASVFSIGKSLHGLPILALRLNSTESGEAPSAKPAIAFLGTHHAREHLSTEVPLLVAKHLLESKDKPEIARLLDTRDIYFIPMVNPDGVEFDIRDDRYHMHRKNLRQNEDGSLGVDLNRNYGYGWGGGGASTDPEDETYRGPAPFSEPESQAVKAFVDARKDTLKILLSYHSFSELILYPWGHSNDPIPDGKALSAYKNMAAAMGEMTGYKPEQSSELYIASGDTTDWAWGTHKIFSFTFELTPKSMWAGGFYPGAAAIQTTVQNNIRPALYLIGLADNPWRAADAEVLSLAPGAAPAGGR